MSTTETIEAPATYGATIKITGDRVGDFLVHKETDYRIVPETEELILGYSVTQIKSGLRFPWRFKRKIDAKKFARGVVGLVDWQKCEAEIQTRSRSNPVVTWKVAPTDEERAAIKEFAAKCGGVR